MQPKTTNRIDRKSFYRIRKTAKNMSKSRREIQNNPTYHTDLPEEIGLQLTKKCNLRCKHCFEWSSKGYNHFLKHESDEIGFDLIEKALFETRKIRSNLYLWGGEPLTYSKFDDLSRLLEKEERWTVLCTNGINIINKLDDLKRMEGNLAILTSLEGFEKENDYIRGKGTFSNAIEGIKEIIRLNENNNLDVIQSVNCTIKSSMIGKLYDFLLYMEAIGIDTLYYCFPWYIPNELATKMDKFFEERFNWLDIKKEIYSWHSFNFKIDEKYIDDLIRDLEKINSRTWKIRLRYQPNIEKEHIEDFISGKDIKVQNKAQCKALCSRMDILYNGNVSACKLFDEFSIGNLRDDSLFNLWNSKKFNRIREIVANDMMPVCSKCILLYLNGTI